MLSGPKNRPFTCNYRGDFQRSYRQLSSLLHTIPVIYSNLLTQPLKITEPSIKPMRLKSIRLPSTPTAALTTQQRAGQRPNTTAPSAPAIRLTHGLLILSAGLVLGLGACTPAPSTSTPAASTSDTASASDTTVQSAASPSATSSEAKVYAKDGVAIKGADPVAYFTDESFVAGSAEHTYEWQGVSWQFATAENRDLFAANPEQYAPQYGGYCAWAVGQNTLAAIDPTAWSIVDGKLYLNANQRIQERWNKDIPGNIALAETNWPELSRQ